MSESIPSNWQESLAENTAEQSSNYEGNESILFFNRMHNPVIRKQLIDFIFSTESEIYPEQQRSKEEINLDLEAKLSSVEKTTEITFPKLTTFPYHTSDRMVVGMIHPVTKTELTTKQMSIAEAHEKGHVVRDFFKGHESTYYKRLSDAFDIDSFVIPSQELAMITERDAGAEEPLDGMKKDYVAYLLDPTEVFERMSELKNYFGFKGDEEFTGEHLEYVKKHYVEDTGADNGMTAFFSLITSRTQSKFLEIINSVGI